MCGIAGFLPSVPLEPGRGEPMLEDMVRSLRHRGPDGCGTWTDGAMWLGHTRLSIIDLSLAGRQPMMDGTGRFVLVYNGEVYNYRELRRELEMVGHTFRSQTDTEVVLAAYREWGAGALQRFNGMWAFAIWDTVARTLFMARDRAGVKPLYYVMDPAHGFYFASEITPLRVSGLRFRLNVQAAFDFLTQGTYGHLGAQGFFDDVRQLPAGHLLHIRIGEAPRITRYWDLPIVSPRDRVRYDEVFRRRFRDLLTDAVRLRLRADVPIGATLSGGLDSSTVVALMDELYPGESLHIFTRQYPGTSYDETPFVDAVTARLHAPVVHHVARCDASSDRLLQVLDHQEEPFGDTSILAHFDLMQAAREAGVPVVLSGQGGDELLLGYPSMVRAYLGHLIANGHLAQAFSELRYWSQGQATVFWPELGAAIPHALPLGLRDRLRQQRVRGLAASVTPAVWARIDPSRFELERERRSFDSYIAQVFKRFALPHLTHYDDRNAMAFSVETRMPFLDYRLVELVFSVDYQALFHRGFTKRVLRETCSDLLPAAVRLRRDKIGFFTPLAAWLREHLDWISSVMSAERVVEFGVLNSIVYRERLAALAAGDDSVQLDVWRGFILHLWADRFAVAPPDLDT